MRILLPYPDFAASARALDPLRLGQQRLDAALLLAALEDGGPFSTHPEAQRWRGYEEALRAYLAAVVEEGVRRGYRRRTWLRPSAVGYPLPPWLGDEALHASHRSYLLREDPERYGRFGWKDLSDLLATGRSGEIRSDRPVDGRSGEICSDRPVDGRSGEIRSDSPSAWLIVKKENDQ